MSDPLARIRPRSDVPDLFDLLPTPAALTTQQAGHVAASKTAAERYRQISELLRTRGPLAGWQIAEALGCQMHQISGRLTEMTKRNEIEDSGERRLNPRTQAPGRVVRIVASTMGQL